MIGYGAVRMGDAPVTIVQKYYAGIQRTAEVVHSDMVKGH